MTALASINTEDSMSSVIPYESHLTEDVVSLDNGSVLAVFRFDGAAHETASDEELWRWHESLSATMMAVAAPDLAFWRTTDHYEVKQFAPGVFEPGSFAHDFNEAYRKRCESESLFANDLYLAVLIQGPSRIGKFGNKSGKGAARDEQIARLDTICARIQESLSAYRPTRLKIYQDLNIRFSEIYAYLALLINGRKSRVPVTPHRAGDILKRCRLTFASGADTFVRDFSDGREFCAILAADAYPSEGIETGHLNKTLSLPFPYVMTHSFTFMGKQDAKTAVELQARRMRATADDAEEELAALRALQSGLTSRTIGLGRHDMQICVAAKDQKTLNRRIAMAEENCTDNGFIVNREDIALRAAFVAQLPGNYAFRPRRAPITTRNFAGLAAFHNYPVGRREGNQWGAATTMFLTDGGSPFFASLHDMRKAKTRGGAVADDDKAPGNTLVIGPIGGGKTTLQTTLVAQSDKAKPTVITFDRSQGQHVFVRAMGGVYTVLQRGEPTGFNFLALEPDESNVAFATSLVRQLAGGNKGLDPEDENLIAKRTRFVMQEEDFDARNLTHLLNGCNGLESSAAERLAQWCEGGAHSWAFNAGADRLDFRGNRHFGFDATSFLNDNDCRVAVMSYLFHRVDRLMGTTNTIINIDEMRAFAKDQFFRLFLEDTLLLNRKRDGIAILGTQQANHVLDSEIRETLVEQTTTKLILPNTQAKAQHYIDGIGLSAGEFNLIQNELPTTNPRAFLFKQPGISAVCNLNLAGMNRELAVLSGTDKLISNMHAAIKESSDDPRDWLPIYYDMLRN